MRRHLTALLLLLVCLTGARSAFAQDAPSVGVTMGYPASVGLLWHVADRIALRPELSFIHNSSETNPLSSFGLQTSADTTNVAVGVTAQFSLHQRDAFRTYIAPRYAFSRLSSSTEGTVLAFESTTRIHSASVAFGAQHRLGDRFAVYGELGIFFDHTETEWTTSEGSGNNIGTRSGVGVVVYF